MFSPKKKIYDDVFVWAAFHVIILSPASVKVGQPEMIAFLLWTSLKLKALNHKL